MSSISPICLASSDYEIPSSMARKYYYAGNQRIAMREGANPHLWLFNDHLGSTGYTYSATTKQGELRYKPFGSTRYTWGSTPTSYRYTGQREEASLGIYYYGARWYDPALGRFIQPDTIVPKPADTKAFDRFAYVNNNPLKYNDPSGHIAVCFHGGYKNSGPKGEGAFNQMCETALSEINNQYGPDAIGRLFQYRNGYDDIDAAYAQILSAKLLDPNEPVVILGYSWGGAAAMDLANRLANAPTVQELPSAYGGGKALDYKHTQAISVDFMFLVDPENDMRTVGSLIPGSKSVNSPDELSNNVRMAVNVYAENWQGGSCCGTDFPGNPQNGINQLRGALNIGLAGQVTIDGRPVTVDHQTIVRSPQGTLNPVTQGLMNE